MATMENKEKVVEIKTEKEGFFKKVGNGAKKFWKKNQWWIMAAGGVITGIAVANKISKNSGEETGEEPCNDQNDPADTFNEIPADTSTEE